MKTSLKKTVEYMEIKYKKIMASKVFTAPLQRVNDEYVKVDKYTQSLINTVGLKVKDSRINLVENIAKLDALSPLKTLTRGYSIAEKDGKVIKNAKALKTGDLINLKFQDGEKSAIIK